MYGLCGFKYGLRLSYDSIISVVNTEQEILKNLQAADSLSPPPPSPFPKEKRFLFLKKATATISYCSNRIPAKTTQGYQSRVVDRQLDIRRVLLKGHKNYNIYVFVFSYNLRALSRSVTVFPLKTRFTFT